MKIRRFPERDIKTELEIILAKLKLANLGFAPSPKPVTEEKTVEFNGEGLA